MKKNEVLCIKQLKHGSSKAFTQIYDAYADKLYCFVLKQLKNSQLAQDIVQDTFMCLWDNRQELDCFGNLQSFIFTIAKHQVIDHFRRQLKQPQFEEFMDYCNNHPADISPEDILLYNEFLSHLTRSKKLLSARELEIYNLSREKHLKAKEIAQQLNLSEQTVKNYLAAALKILRAEMAKYSLLFLFLV